LWLEARTAQVVFKLGLSWVFNSRPFVLMVFSVDVLVGIGSASLSRWGVGGGGHMTVGR